MKAKAQTEVSVKNRTQTEKHDDKTVKLEVKQAIMSEAIINEILIHEETLEQQQYGDDIPISI